MGGRGEVGEPSVLVFLAPAKSDNGAVLSVSLGLDRRGGRRREVGVRVRERSAIAVFCFIEGFQWWEAVQLKGIYLHGQKSRVDGCQWLLPEGT